MTRIFDALKKAEASREATAKPTGPPVVPDVRGRVAGRLPLEAAPEVMPLIGAVAMGEEVLREMASLRVSLESSLRDRPSRIVMFLSPQGGEGTSTVTLQFAQALARDSGLRPLLVDAQARRPAYLHDAVRRCAVLHPQLAERPDRTGEQASAVASNLYVVHAPDDMKATGLFQPARLRQLLDAVVGGFDWIVIDGPPVLESPDAAALGALADGVVLIIQAGRTKRPVLNRTTDLLHKAGARVLGSVLNRRIHEIPEFIYKRI